MTPAQCPACGAKLRPDMTACPNCPMSFPEDDGPRGVENPLKQSPYYKFLLPVLFFGGLAWGVWALSVGFLRLGEENVAQSESLSLSREKEVVKGAGSSMAQAGAKDPLLPAIEKAMASEKAPAGANPPAISSASSSAREADDDSYYGGGVLIISHADDEPARPASRPVRQWKLRGSVYDLTTLKPLAGVALDFKDQRTDKVVRARTDSSGRYRAAVAPLGDDRGYSVTVSKAGYASNYLDPSIAGVKTFSAGRRREIARNLTSASPPSPATVSAAGAAPVVTDFYLAPRP
jgi:hypothetical protein